MDRNTISLWDRSEEILNFFVKNRINISTAIKSQLLELMTRMCTYEEEEVKIYPHVIIGHNIEEENFERIFSGERIHLSSEKNDMLFMKNLKPMLPFCNNGWRVYVNIGAEKNDYGIMRNFSGIEGVVIDEILTSNSEEECISLYEDYGISYVLLTPLNGSSFEIVGMNGERLCVDFSLLRDKNGDKEQKQKFISDFVMDVNDEKVSRSIQKIVDIFPMKLHGAICLVVDKDCQLPNEQLKDGIFLDEPIDILKRIKEILDKNIAHSSESVRRFTEEYYAITGLFIEMLNFDGITIVDNKGRIRAYNVFITPESGENISSGGARKRAAEALLNTHKSKYIGVYFQSQDGNYFYERIR